MNAEEMEKGFLTIYYSLFFRRGAGVVVPPVAGSAYGGNGAVSPARGGSAYGGKTVVFFEDGKFSN
jgi:hypothetical protein